MDLGVAPPPPPPPPPPKGAPARRNKSSGRSRGRSRSRSATDLKNYSSNAPPPPPPPLMANNHANQRNHTSSPVIQQQKNHSSYEEEQLLQQQMLRDSTVSKIATTPSDMMAPPSPSFHHHHHHNHEMDRLASSPRNNVKTAEDILEERRRAAFAMYTSTELVHDRENEAPPMEEDPNTSHQTMFDDADDEELPPPEDWEQQDPKEWGSTHSDYNGLVVTTDNDSLALSDPTAKSPPSALLANPPSRTLQPQKTKQPAADRTSSTPPKQPQMESAPRTPLTTEKKKKRNGSKTPGSSSGQRSSNQTPPSRSGSRQRSSSKTPRRPSSNADISSPSPGSEKKKKGFFKKMFSNNNKDKSVPSSPSTRSPNVRKSSSKKKMNGSHSAEVTVDKKRHAEVMIQKEKVKTKHYAEVAVNKEELQLQQQKLQYQQDPITSPNDLTVSSYSTDSGPHHPHKMEQQFDNAVNNNNNNNNNNHHVVPSTPPLAPKKVEETTPMMVEEEDMVAAALAETIQQQRASATQFIRNRDAPFVVESSVSIDEVSEMTDPTFSSEQQKKNTRNNKQSSQMKESASATSSASGKEPSGRAPMDPFKRGTKDVSNGFFQNQEGTSSDETSIDPFSKPFFEEEPLPHLDEKKEDEDEEQDFMTDEEKEIKEDPPTVEVDDDPSGVLSDILAPGSDEHDELMGPRGVESVFRTKRDGVDNIKVSAHSLKSNKSEISNGGSMASGSSNNSATLAKALKMLQTRDSSDGGEKPISRSQSRESGVSTSSSAINARAWARRKGGAAAESITNQRSSSFGVESAAISDTSQSSAAALQAKSWARRRTTSPQQDRRGGGKSGPPMPEQMTARSKQKPVAPKSSTRKAPPAATGRAPVAVRVKPSPFLTKNAAKSRKGKQRVDSAQQQQTQHKSYSKSSSQQPAGIASRVDRNGTGSYLSRPPTRMVKEKERTTIKSSLYGKPTRRNPQYVDVEPQVVDTYSVSYGMAIQRQHCYEMGPRSVARYVDPEEERKLALSRNTSSYSGIVESQIVDPIQLAGVRLLSKSAVPIQTEVRRYLAQKEAVDRMIGLIEIQCYFRRWKSEAFKRANVHAAITIQTAFRGWMVRDVLEDEHYCAGIIQIYVRSLLAKKRVQEVRSAIKVQARWRSYAAQLHYQFDVVDIIIVQNLVRRWLARKQLEILRWEKQYFSAIKIQSHWRRYLAHTDYIFTIADILVIQRTFRKWLAQSELANRKLQLENQTLNDAATVIQSAFRRYSARMNLLYDMVNIIMVQSLVRRRLARNRTVELIAEHIAARRIQTKWRLVSHAVFKKQRQAAIDIQRTWRGFWMHSHYIIMSFEASRIQAVWRGYSAMKEADLKLGCTIILQSIARRYLARRRSRQIRLVQVLVGSASFSMRENIASTCIGQWWGSILATRKRNTAARVIQNFFKMVQAEVNMEILRHNRKKELKREKRRRKKQESEEMMLERVWLNTVTGDVLRSSDVRRSRSRSSSRSRSAPRPRSERPMTPSSVASRPTTPTSVDGASLDGSYFAPKSPGRSRSRSRGRQTKPQQKKSQISSSAVLSKKRDEHRVKNSPKAGTLDTRGHPLNTDRVKNSPKSRTGFDPRGFVADVNTSYNSRTPRVQVDTLKLAQSEDQGSEISGITTPLDSHISAVYSRTGVPSRDSTFTGKQLSDDLSLEEAWMDTKVRQAKEKKQSDDQYFQRHGINRSASIRSRPDGEMRHSGQYQRRHASPGQHEQGQHQHQTRPRAYRRPQASFDQPNRPPSHNNGRPMPRHQQQKPPPLRTQSPIRNQPPLRNQTPVVRNVNHAPHQYQQQPSVRQPSPQHLRQQPVDHVQPAVRQPSPQHLRQQPVDHVQPAVRQPSPQHLRQQPVDPVPTTEAMKPLDPSPRNQLHVQVAMPSPSRGSALSPPGASPPVATPNIYAPSPTYLSRPSPSGVSPRHFDSPQANPAREAHSPHARQGTYSPSAQHDQRDQLRRGVV